MNDTFQRVKKITAGYLEIPEDIITPDSSFNYDLGADSIDDVSIVMALEAEFSVEILQEINREIQTVQDAVDCINLILKK